ncbi:MAG: hypothetical protein KAH38_09740, partial [Candidatus Hydrogenedentes bacterium]|nr:hypothetical protein [Candidatus Hydrogenedentota bacterium]
IIVTYRPTERTLSSMQLSILIIATALLGHSCAAQEERPLPFSFLDDLTLSHGFQLSAVESSMSPIEVGAILVADAQEQPKWRLAQWGTRFSLESAQEQSLTDGTRLMKNQGKQIKILPGGLADQGVYLEVNAGTEYGEELRQYNESWPHLLIEQYLTRRPLHEFESLEFNLEFLVKKCDVTTEKPLNPGLHTAQITAYWTIHNVNKESPDYNDMIWFGIPLYDVRYPIPRGHQAVDVGQENATGKFIFTLDGERFYKRPVSIGKWHTLACDLVPLIREALAASQSKGFLMDTTYEDLTATSFNLGWEVPGPYHCAITLRKLHLLGYTDVEKKVLCQELLHNGLDKVQHFLAP